MAGEAQRNVNSLSVARDVHFRPADPGPSRRERPRVVAVREASMNPRSYVDLKESSRNLQPTYYFMINCLLYSRMETGLVSNQDFYDEDVNVYLAHLLHSFINPDYVEQSKKYLSRYDADVFKRLASSSDARLKYAIYKTNADFLLVSIGIFDNPVAPEPGARPRVVPAEEAYIGRGKTYYHFAYTYAQQVHRKNQGVSEVLEKLSVGFDKYIKILSHMRGEYLDLAQRFSDGEVYHLERSVDESARQEVVKAKQDQLLELYTQWKEAPSAEIEENVKRLVGEIQEITPSFRFALPASVATSRRRSTAETGPNTVPETVAGSSQAPAPTPAPQTPPARPSTRAARTAGDATATGVSEPDSAPGAKKKPRSRTPKRRSDDASTN